MGLPTADRVRQLEDARAARGGAALAGGLASAPGARTGTLGVFPPFTVLAEVAGS